MRFDDDVLCERDGAGDGRIIRGRNGGGVEEAAAVVELELFGPGAELRQRMVDLSGNCAVRDGPGRRVFPQIAQQTAPRTFLVGQQNRSGTDDVSGTGALFFKKKTARLEGIERRGPGWPLRRDPRRLIPLW